MGKSKTRVYMNMTENIVSTSEQLKYSNKVIKQTQLKLIMVNIVTKV